MEENKDRRSNDFEDFNDDQERAFYRLSSIWDKRLIDSQKIKPQLRELKLLQVILHSLIILGIIAFFILLLIKIHLIIIIIDIGVIIFYIFYLKYLKYKLRKSLKITKKDLKIIIRLEKQRKELLKLNTIFYFIIIIATNILIYWMIGIDPWILIIILGGSLLWIYFDQNIEDENNYKI